MAPSHDHAESQGKPQGKPAAHTQAPVLSPDALRRLVDRGVLFDHYDALVFDHDGTLADTMPTHV